MASNDTHQQCIYCNQMIALLPESVSIEFSNHNLQPQLSSPKSSKIRWIFYYEANKDGSINLNGKTKCICRLCYNDPTILQKEENEEKRFFANKDNIDVQCIQDLYSPTNPYPSHWILEGRVKEE